MRLFLCAGLVWICSFASLVRAEPVKSGIDRNFFDPSVRFQDDLYLAANGHWLNTTEIPPDRSNFGALMELEEKTRQRLGEILKAAAAAPQARGSDLQKLGDLYRSYLDTAAVEKAGLQPLQELLDEVRKISTVDELVHEFGRLTQDGVETPLGFFVGVDRGNSKYYLAGVGQGGLGLPDRDYYLKDDGRFQKSRAAYLKYAETIFSLSGADSGQASDFARRVLALETKLAEANWTKVQLRDPEKTYHKMQVGEVTKNFGEIPWLEFLRGLGQENLAQLDLQEPSYLTASGRLLRSESLDTWRRYLELRVIAAFAAGLPRAYEVATFELYGKVLAGVPAEKTRETKAIELIAGSGTSFGLAGDLVGKIYVEKYFPPAAKTKIDRLVQNLLEAYDRSLTEVTWLTDETKEKTRSKLKQYSALIGYPKHPRDYAEMQIDANHLVGNLLAAARYEYLFNVQKLGREVDREEWELTPQTVNAYYEPTKNQIVFPAAILQAPLFNVDADDAANYGAIGAIIGHEISHGFDDEGSRYDGSGTLKDWWTAADRDSFHRLTSRLIAQYAAYEPLPGKHINAELTLGENIADVSGVAIAFKAYRKNLHGAEAPVIDGLTGDQRFFISWAQAFHRKYREEELARRLLVDPHSPSRFRVNGAVENLDAFAMAFDIKPADKMYLPPAQRIHLW